MKHTGLNALDDAEKRIVVECLRAASDGPFFADWEFHSLFGLDRHRIRLIANSSPKIDDSSDEVALAINNAMTNLTGYPHNQQAAWSQFISVPEEEVTRIFSKWRGDTVT